jgi:7-keto-8-aminopelargonate synthetase-like enzyme
VWYLNPKNIIMLIMSIAIIGIGATYLFQRSTIESMEADNKRLISDNLIQSATISAQNRNIKAIEAHQQRVQVIENNTQTVREIIREIKPDIPLGGNCNDVYPEDKQQIQDAVAAAVTLFNTGVYTRPGDHPSGKEILPAAGGTEADPPDKGASKDGG